MEAREELLELSPEQVRTMTAAEKDLWWFENVFRGNAPQLTLRAALTGMLLGGLLSLTNIYIGYRTGWTMGIGITSVILSFAMFSLMAKLRLTSPMTLLENNAMQSIATSAGYVLSPLFSSLGAYMMITHQLVPQHQAIIWMVCVSILGVLFAFPLKRRFINEEQHPFPEGKAAGIVMHSLHHAGSRLKVYLLMMSLGITAFLSFLKEETLIGKIGERWRGLGWLKHLSVPELFDAAVYKALGWSPTIRGISFEKLTIGIESDFPLIAAGGLMSIRTGASLLLGAVINYGFLAPWLMRQGIVSDAGGFRNITKWSLWFGVALMTSASLTSFFAKPGMIVGAFKGLLKKRGSEIDVLKNIELPLWVSAVGVPIIGSLVAVLTHTFFHVPLWTGFAAIPIVFMVTIIAVHSTALTSVTPSGAIGKLTQLAFSVMSPGRALPNLMAAGIAGEVVTNAANLCMDIKPGYMLGAKPRQQALGHVFGIFAGSLVAVPVWYHLFGGDIARLGTKEFPMPGAVVWKAVAEMLAQGLGAIHPMARWAMLIGLILGVLLEIAVKVSKDRFPLSAMGLGLAFVMPFTNSFSMFLGCFLFWFVGRLVRKDGWFDRTIMENQEAICAGGIAGGSITSILFRLFS